MRSRPDGHKIALTTFSSPLYFTVYRGGQMVLFQRNLYFQIFISKFYDDSYCMVCAYVREDNP